MTDNTDTIITEQPKSILKKQIDQTDVYSHQCLCEQYCTKPCKNSNPKIENCYSNCYDWCDFYIYCYHTRTENPMCFSVLCFPIVFPIKVIFCLPCACYNECRNCCNKTDKKNYLC